MQVSWQVIVLFSAYLPAEQAVTHFLPETSSFQVFGGQMSMHIFEISSPYPVVHIAWQIVVEFSPYPLVHESWHFFVEFSLNPLWQRLASTTGKH